MSKTEEFNDMVDFVIDNIHFSYSALSTFDNCKYCYRLSYIDKREPKENNFFAEYGLLTHDCIEKYFDGTLESYELSGYFRDQYNHFIVTPPPPFPRGMEGNYIQQGEDFFDTFYFDKDAYDIVFNEDEVRFNIVGVEFIGRPDLVLKEKITGEHILLDYKTSVPFRYDKRKKKETADKKKIEGYFKQMYIYAYGVKKVYSVQIDKILIWFTRAQREVKRDWKKEEEKEALQWVKKTIKKIKNEKEFLHNNSSAYFCNFLCGVREHCEYKIEI